MKDKDKKRAPYEKPTITNFGKVTTVTAATGMAFVTDTCFTGSMVFGSENHECIPGQS